MTDAPRPVEPQGPHILVHRELLRAWQDRAARAEADLATLQQETERLVRGHDEYNRVNQLMQAEIDRLSALVHQTREALTDFYEAMSLYEMEVEEGPPQKHREMMERAQRLLAAAPTP